MRVGGQTRPRVATLIHSHPRLIRPLQGPISHFFTSFYTESQPSSNCYNTGFVNEIFTFVLFTDNDEFHIKFAMALCVLFTSINTFKEVIQVTELLRCMHGRRVWGGGG